jgi:hypothetical protein
MAQAMISHLEGVSCPERLARTAVAFSLVQALAALPIVNGGPLTTVSSSKARAMPMRKRGVRQKNVGSVQALPHRMQQNHPARGDAGRGTEFWAVRRHSSGASGARPTGFARRMLQLQHRLADICRILRRLAQRDVFV